MANLILGVVLIVIWVILLVTATPQSGWVHLPLAGGFVFIALGIVQRSPGAERSGDD